MQVLNILWGFSPGGIANCFLSYNRLNTVCPEIAVRSVCIDPANKQNDLSRLAAEDIDIVRIANNLDISWISEIKSIVRRQRPDVLFCHGFNGPVVAWFLKKYFRLPIPIVCTYHGVYHPPTRMKRLVSPLFNKIQQTFYRTAAALVITVAQKSTNQLLAKGVHAHKLLTIPNGIPDMSRQIQRSDAGVLRLITVSRLDAIKGIDVLLQAFAMVRSKVHQEMELMIVGDGPEMQRLRQETRKLRLGGMVSFQGFQQNVTPFLDQADIFILPSHSECHPIALLEAMRAGKAIIATHVGDNAITIRQNMDGILVPAGDHVVLADAMMQLISDTQLQQRLGSNARQRFLDRYTEHKMLSSLAQTFKSVA